MKPVIKGTKIVSIGSSRVFFYRKLPKRASVARTDDLVLPLWPGKSSKSAFTIVGRTFVNWSLEPLLTTFPS
jgi:hypothetical protein